MRNIIKFYNQNRLTFWMIILIIIFIIFLLNFFNGLAKQESEKKFNESKSISNSVQNSLKSTKQINEPVISGENINKNKQNKNEEILKSFIDYCKDQEIEKAYNLLSKNCKEIYYKTQEEFEEKYFNGKFSSDKEVEYELWNSGRNDIYRIKIFDNILSTGKANSGKFIEDFYTVVNEDDTVKLNINNYIGRKYINVKETKENLEIKVEYVDIFKEYFKYQLNVKNNGNKNIILDTREKTNSVYLTNNNNVKFIGLLYENLKNDLIIKANEEKNINLKFNVVYRNDLGINKMVFSDIILDENNMDNKSKIEIEI